MIFTSLSIVSFARIVILYSLLSFVRQSYSRVSQTACIMNSGLYCLWYYNFLCMLCRYNYIYCIPHSLTMNGELFPVYLLISGKTTSIYGIFAFCCIYPIIGIE